MRLVALAIVGAALAGAQDLSSMRAALAAMRTKTEDLPLRGMRPEFASLKTQLRELVELRLTGYTPRDSAKEFAERLNRELQNADLLCGDCHVGAWYFLPLGFLEEVRVEPLAENLLSIVTGLGIECGFDESVYVYRWSGAGWQRVLASETSDYTDSYFPLRLVELKIAADPDDSNFNIMTVGQETWCTSSWHALIYRVWHVNSAAHLLVESGATAHWTDPVKTALRRDEMLIEFGGLSGKLVRRYRFAEDGTARRVEPIAFDPAAFVAEWLTARWPEASTWSEDSILEQRRNRVKLDYGPAVRHCESRPDVWQVEMNRQDYFLVRWHPPFEFRLLALEDRPAPGCTEEDAGKYEGTLFLEP